MFLTSIVGVTGVLLNSRPMLALYNLFLWPCLMSTAIIGYTSYKRNAFNLSGKINQGWSEVWGDSGRLVVQNSVRDESSFSSNVILIMYPLAALLWPLQSPTCCLPLIQLPHPCYVAGLRDRAVPFPKANAVNRDSFIVFSCRPRFDQHRFGADLLQPCESFVWERFDPSTISSKVNSACPYCILCVLELT